MAVREIHRNNKTVWQVDVTSRELNKRERKTFSDKVSAEKYEKDLLFAWEKGLPSPRTSDLAEISTNTKGYTVKQAFDDCYEECWKGGKSDAKMVQKGNAIMAYFGRYELLSNITSVRIKQWKRDQLSGKAKLDGKPVCGATVNRNLSCLSKIMRVALEEDKLAKMPVIRKEKDSVNRVRWISDEEERAILATLRMWTAEGNNCLNVEHAYIVSVDTGMRASELRRIERKHMTTNGLYVGLTKNGQPRVVPLTDRAKRILEIRCKIIEGDLLFPYGENWYRHKWEEVLEHLGLDDVVWHTLRHTCASRLAQNGVGLAEIKEWLGHETIITTQKYAHLNPSALQRSVGLLSSRVDAIGDAQAQM